MFPRFFALCGLVTAAFSAAPTTASTITFSSPGWEYQRNAVRKQADWRVEVADTSAGQLIFSLSIDPSSEVVGDILGFGFSTDFELAEEDLRFLGSSTGEGITGLYTGRRCGSGCSFSRRSFEERDHFDYLIRIGDKDKPNGLVTSFAFYVDVGPEYTFTETSVTAVGIRGKHLGVGPDGGNGSSRDVNFVGSFTEGAPLPPTSPLTPETPAPVPLPAAAWLLFAALGALGLTRVRQKRPSV